MPREPLDQPVTARSRPDRRKHPRQHEPGWGTAITQIEPNKILLRGYAVDELMGRLSFAEAVYVLLRGELPSHSIGKLFDAVLVAAIDHGVTPPSTIAARNAATSGASLRSCAAAGVLGFGTRHGGDIESCMRFLQRGLALVRGGMTYPEAAEQLTEECRQRDERAPGFGHRIHTSDPRASRLVQMAHELELDGEHVRMLRTLERQMAAKGSGLALSPNLDGAIAAVCGDLGFEPELGSSLFMIARVPGLVAHAHEERARQAPMRQINPLDAMYDGPRPRRLPETRK